ncbi:MULTISPECIES: DUF4190 domain-containing protein [Micrococcaceae]|uniref:DUF4190 domain-containing protein n=1 Tax=Micrococcaceae TaxID=1268 RepID=UPI000CFBD86D|nr:MULTISPECIES: DUF4190 domain-containing protein [unclassified Arthrobacter]MCS3493956.1 putative membrane protein [Arthrobacter sp. JUb119]PQZ85339.1 hypothetical protein CQ016_13820 [Arthrobacter sp. MYb222]PRB75063.1 hypothetical protein CQ012_10970 [Arthrobacter sp. MYb214]TDU26961.1 uncharacterized protein DUF4190 [Arthrobacter sp. JUb115]
MSYYQYPQNPYQRPPESAGLSVASLVLGILSLLGFTVIILVPLAGVITGHLAYRREPSSRGLSLAGLITSWIGLALAIVIYAVAIWFFWALSTGFGYDSYYDNVTFSQGLLR